MAKQVLSIVVLLSVAVLAPSAGAANSERGQLLYENHCMGCHESVVHVRERRSAKTLDELRGEVSRWALELKLGWTGEDVQDVAGYLNGRYYHLTD